MPPSVEPDKNSPNLLTRTMKNSDLLLVLGRPGAAIHAVRHILAQAPHITLAREPPVFSSRGSTSVRCKAHQVLQHQFSLKQTILARWLQFTFGTSSPALGLPAALMEPLNQAGAHGLLKWKTKDAQQLKDRCSTVQMLSFSTDQIMEGKELVPLSMIANFSSAGLLSPVQHPKHWL